jgi:hypothetical protein
MARSSYKRCRFDGDYHHKDEMILIPEDAPRADQKWLCLDHAEQFLKHLISEADLTTLPYFRRKSA